MPLSRAADLHLSHLRGRAVVSPVDRAAYLALYASLGFTTIPVQSRGKRPLRRGWRAGDAEAWLDAPPDANVGILCGDASGGLVVLDFDEEDGPHEVLRLTPRELAAHTMVVRTARGWHVYVRRTRTSTRSPRPGLDVRAEGSMVVAPPSMHSTGTKYQFVSATRCLADAGALGIDDEVLNTNTGGGREAPAAPPPGPAPPAAAVCVDWGPIEAWISLQSPKLRTAWQMLRNGEVDDKFDRSRADFAVARCLAEGGWSDEVVVAVLLALPGSKAAERGQAYALRTALRAGRR